MRQSCVSILDPVFYLIFSTPIGEVKKCNEAAIYNGEIIIQGRTWCYQRDQAVWKAQNGDGEDRVAVLLLNAQASGLDENDGDNLKRCGYSSLLYLSL